jgi:hypothetical protein
VENFQGDDLETVGWRYIIGLPHDSARKFYRTKLTEKQWWEKNDAVTEIGQLVTTLTECVNEVRHMSHA